MSSVQKILHSAYSFIRGTESNKAIGALTLDHLLQEQIDRLQKGSFRSIVDVQGQEVDVRLSVWDRLDTLEKDIDRVIDAINTAGDDSDRLAALGFQEANL